MISLSLINKLRKYTSLLDNKFYSSSSVMYQITIYVNEQQLPMRFCDFLTLKSAKNKTTNTLYKSNVFMLIWILMLSDKLQTNIYIVNLLL